MKWNISSAVQVFSTLWTLWSTGNNGNELLPGVDCLTITSTLFYGTKDLNIKGTSFSSIWKPAGGCLPCGYFAFVFCVCCGGLTNDSALCVREWGGLMSTLPKAVSFVSVSGFSVTGLYFISAVCMAVSLFCTWQWCWEWAALLQALPVGLLTSVPGAQPCEPLSCGTVWLQVLNVPPSSQVIWSEK